MEIEAGIWIKLMSRKNRRIFLADMACAVVTPWKLVNSKFDLRRAEKDRLPLREPRQKITHEMRVLIKGKIDPV